MTEVRAAFALPRRSAFALVAALLLGTPAVCEEELNASPADTEATPEAPAQSNADAEPADEPAPKRNGQSRERLAAPDVFTPSEEISEDIAVPFPVDI